jgi:hypothetical protein
VEHNPTKGQQHDLVENEGNEYSVADPSRMMISMFSELNEDHKEVLKRNSKKTQSGSYREA